MKFCLEYLMIVCRGQVSSFSIIIYFLKTFVVDGLSSKNLISLIVLLLIRITFTVVLSADSYFIYLVLLVIYALLFQSMSIQTILDNLELETSHYLIFHSETNIRQRFFFFFFNICFCLCDYFYLWQLGKLRKINVEKVQSL